MKVPSSATWDEIESRVTAHGSTWDNLSFNPEKDIRNAMREVDEIILRTGIESKDLSNKFRISRLGNTTLLAMATSSPTTNHLPTTVVERSLNAA